MIRRLVVAGFLLVAAAGSAFAQVGAAYPLPPEKPGTGGERQSVTLSQATMTTTVLGQDDFQDLGTRFPVDVLRMTPGVEVQRVSSVESSVSVRSYNDDSSASQGILGLLDGRPTNNEFFGSVLWETLPLTLDDLERIEIIRGPGGFLHGPNAMHGYVHLTTRSPLDFQGERVLLHGFAGTYGSNLESFVYVRREGDSALKIKAAHDDIDEFEPRHRNAKDKAFFEARFESLIDGPDHRIDLAAGASDQKFSTLIPPFSGLPEATFQADSLETFARIDYTLDRLKVRASTTHFETDATPDQIYAPFSVFLDVADVDLQYTHQPLLFNTFTSGTGWRYASFETQDQDVADGRHHTQLRWVFLQDEIALGPVKVTGGMRVDDHSVVGTTWSPRAAVHWTIDPIESGPEVVDGTGHSVRFAYGAGFRNPSLREIWFDMPVLSGAGRVAGNEDLDAEKIRSMELGYVARPTSQLQVEATVYYNLIDRLISFVPAAPGVFAPKNTGKEDAYGMELQLQYQVHRTVFGFANYAYGIRRDRDTDERNPGAPRHKASAGLRYSDPEAKTAGFGGMLWVSYFDDVEFVDPSSGASLGEADEYALVNGQIHYRFQVGTPSGKVFVQAFNLLDHDHREHPQGEEYGLILMGGLDLTW